MKIECIKCEKRLSSNRSLKRHTTNVHEPEKSYESRSECKKCGNNLHTDSIRRQMTNVHIENTDESLSECKKLQTEWIPTHSGKKSNTCNQCDYASSKPWNLRRHLKTHSGEKSNKCNQCDYVSSRAGDLRKHMIIHRGEK